MSDLPHAVRDAAKFITPKEFAAYRGVDVRTVIRWLAKGRVPGEQIGGRNGNWVLPAYLIRSEQEWMPPEFYDR